MLRDVFHLSKTHRKGFARMEMATQARKPGDRTFVGYLRSDDVLVALRQPGARGRHSHRRHLRGDGPRRNRLPLRSREIEEMARCALEVLSDPAKAQAMGERGRERARKCFSRDRVIGQYEDLYRELLR